MNTTICQIVDSAGSLPSDFIENHNIKEVAFYFKFEKTDYLRENIDYSARDFFKHMEEYPNDVPKTAAPNPHDWLSLFQEKYNKGARKYIVTTISSKLSNSFQAAMSAKALFEEENKDIKIDVIDSNTCACGQAALEIWIANMIGNRMDFEDIVEKIYKMRSKVNSLFVVDSLKYMEAGGRIGKATAFLGKMTNIKPISEFINGEVHVIRPSIGRKRSLRLMIDEAVSRINDINKAIITIQNAKAEKDADYMRNYLLEKANKDVEIFSSDLGITVGAHSGPGAIGIGFLETF
ncbi:MAG TPA: DegV family protein [Tissierellaceae bacterium]|nr:DegV family protein [Tissierellaceae bacterium]